MPGVGCLLVTQKSRRNGQTTPDGDSWAIRHQRKAGSLSWVYFLSRGLGRKAEKINWFLARAFKRYAKYQSEKYPWRFARFSGNVEIVGKLRKMGAGKEAYLVSDNWDVDGKQATLMKLFPLSSVAETLFIKLKELAPASSQSFWHVRTNVSRSVAAKTIGIPKAAYIY